MILAYAPMALVTEASGVYLSLTRSHSSAEPLLCWARPLVLET